MQQKKPKDASGIATLFLFLFVFSAIANIFLYTEVMNAKKFLPKRDMMAAASPTTLTRDLLTAEAKETPEGDQKFEYNMGMRKNMIFTGENCIAEECLYLKQSGYPKLTMNDAMKKSYASFAEKFFMFVAHAKDAKKAFGTPFTEGIAVLNILHARMSSIADKYEIGVQDTFGTVQYTDKKDACMKLSKELSSLIEEYNASMTKTYANYKDISYVLGQMSSIVTLVHKPVLAACSQ